MKTRSGKYEDFNAPYNEITLNVEVPLKVVVTRKCSSMLYVDELDDMKYEIAKEVIKKIEEAISDVENAELFNN